MSVNHSNMKLGKQVARHDPRTLLMASYLKLPPIPPSRDYTLKASSNWGMMLNDTLGDCTCAAAGHLTQVWTANASVEVTTPDDKIRDAYEAVSGYNPMDPNTDRGANEMDVLNYWRKTGIGGRKIQSYMGLEPKNHFHICAAVDLFGGAYIGLALPVSAQTQDVWSVPPGGPSGPGAPGSWGGHAVIIEAYDDHLLTCITWGQKKQMTWSFWDTYCDEAYALLSDDWLSAKGVNPDGFNLAQLQVDLKQVTG